MKKLMFHSFAREPTRCAPACGGRRYVRPVSPQGMSDDNLKSSFPYGSNGNERGNLAPMPGVLRRS